MTGLPAVCYVATPGHLFQTVLSAVQARAHLPAATAVVIVVVVRAGTTFDPTPLDRISDDNRLTVVAVDEDELQGLHVTYGRLFLDRCLPAEIDEILYIDGDTQIQGDLEPLLLAAPPPGGLLAAMDPMVFIHRTTRGFRRKVEAWWDDSAIPLGVRSRYVNAGVFRIRRTDLVDLREGVLELHRRSDAEPRFRDQDLINIVLEDRVSTVGMEWNFPGFLIGTGIAETVRPRVVHFMSDPRPWQAPFAPWGRHYFEPYAELARRYPELGPLWQQVDRTGRARYTAQQLYKRLVEKPTWQSRRAVDAVRAMQDSSILLR